MSNRLGVVNLDTGELHRELKDDDRITTKEQREFYKKRVNVKYEGKFVNNMDKNLKEVSDKLTLSQLGLFASLFRFMDFKDKRLKHDGRNLTKTTISKILGLNYHTTNKQLKGLVDSDLLIAHKVGNHNEYEINDSFVFIGKFLKKEFSTKIFTVKFAEMTDGMKLNEIGLFYRLIPYVNTERYVLCYNPYETDVDGINAIQTYTEIANIVGVDRSHISKLMNKIGSKYLIINVAAGKNNVFVVNPELVSRKPEKVTLKEIIDVIKSSHKE